jgi:hypothetical protein
MTTLTNLLADVIAFGLAHPLWLLGLLVLLVVVRSVAMTVYTAVAGR